MPVLLSVWVDTFARSLDRTDSQSDTGLTALSDPKSGINASPRLILAKANTHKGTNNERRLEDLTTDQNNSNNSDSQNTVLSQEQYQDNERLEQQRSLFLQAEDALESNNNTLYKSLAEQIRDYPLYPYIQYRWLQKHLHASQQIENYLTQYKDSYYAGKLKQQWLLRLAKNSNWPMFLQHYTAGDHAKLNCYYFRALYNSGNKMAALSGARTLWSAGHSQPAECDPLFTQLMKSEFFTADLRWQRFDAALQNNKTSLARYVKNLMPESEQPVAQLWLNLHSSPARYMSQLLSHDNNTRSASMFIHAVNRLARTDPNAAIEVWDKYQQQFNIDSIQANEQEKQLASTLAYRGEPGAYQRLARLGTHDENSKAWLVRAALSAQNWQNVLSTIQALNKQQKENEKWQYWLARALLETGDDEQADKIFTKLSRQRSYYGYLAADRVNRLYQLSDNPLPITADEIHKLENRREFMVAAEFRYHDRLHEAKLQWWHALSKLNNRYEILIAAKLAQQWNWDEIAIFTIAKAEYWDDIELRFPLRYSDEIFELSEQYDLNPAILFGLIRRESAFNENALSPAGARGLMQIMPGTARDIARHFKERWRGSSSLFNPATNLKYGSWYYQNLLDRFDGHYAIALAAYNAGPERVKQWLPKQERMPADIWIESIPYRETRNYVIAILAYTLIYQQLTQSDEKLTMNALTPDVEPVDSPELALSSRLTD